MTTRGPTSFASKWLIGVLLILVASAILPGTTAHAEECLSAPNSPAREGTQWRYRLDWATQRKCWYMRAIDPSTHQTIAHPEAAPPAPALAIPIPSPGPPATGSAMSVNRANQTPPSPNREEIDTKTTTAPPLGGPIPIQFRRNSLHSEWAHRWPHLRQTLHPQSGQQQTKPLRQMPLCIKQLRRPRWRQMLKHQQPRPRQPRHRNSMPKWLRRALTPPPNQCIDSQCGAINSKALRHPTKQVVKI